MSCAKCGGGNVVIQAVTETEQRGCLNILLWIILAFVTCGIIVLLVPVMRGKKSKTVSYAICQSCGYRRQVA